MSNQARFETYPERHRWLTGEYGWRFRAADGKISAVGGEGFTRREDARRAINDFTVDVGCHEVIDLDENGDVIDAPNHMTASPDA
jgi:uncharacterized protein YegP (UPF0339 family)